MKIKFLNRKLFAIHSWLGLFIGLFYLLIAISGAISVFRFELNSLIYGSKMDFKNPESQKRVPYDTIFSMARREFPDMPYYVCGFDNVFKNRPAYYSAVMHIEPDLFSTSMQYHVNYLNPYTAENLLQTDSKGRNNVIDWLMGFHYSFALGEGGEFFAVIVDFALLVSILTGFIFYRKYVIKVLLFRVKIRFSNWRLASSGLHRVIGTWALLFNLLIFSSGLYIQKKFFISNWWSKYGETSKGNGKHVHPIHYPKSTVSLDSLATVACQMAPEMQFQGFAIECSYTGSITAFGASRDKMFLQYDNFAQVRFDSTGKSIGVDYEPWETYKMGEKFDNINFGLLHTGWALGTTGKIIWCVMGLTPAFLSITGFLLWLRKKIRKA